MYLRQYYGSGSGPIWLDDLQCSGEEMSLAECGHRGWGVHNCDHVHDVSIVCGNSTGKRFVTKNSARLHRGFDPLYRDKCLTGIAVHKCWRRYYYRAACNADAV